MNLKQKKVAVVLLNLGGPDCPNAIEPFLFNLFNDRHIITLSQPLRYLLAKLISKMRLNKTRYIYEKLSGKSPIFGETKLQAIALEKQLNTLHNDITYSVFIAMRYWHPMTEQVVQDVKAFDPDQIILLPLYPQYSTTTTLSSLRKWFEVVRKLWCNHPKTDVVCCYYDNSYFIGAHSNLLLETLQSSNKHGQKTRILFSAHGLPQKIINNGDPYRFQVETTAKQIIARCKEKIDMTELKYTICYQSKVGQLKWLEPSTTSEIVAAAYRKEDVVVVPISFVSEHSETLVELDIDYQSLAKSYNVNFFRVSTLRTNEIFIKGLASMCVKLTQNQHSTMESKVLVNNSDEYDNIICPHAMCCKRMKLI